MDYTLTKPCEACPFRRGTPMVLTEGRCEEIIGGMLSRNGGEFPCHKTLDYTDGGGGREKPNSQHCAGALIFAEKHENLKQILRITERLGMYDGPKLMSNQEDRNRPRQKSSH